MRAAAARKDSDLTAVVALVGRVRRAVLLAQLARRRAARVAKSLAVRLAQLAAALAEPPAPDVEAAALPQEWRSLSEGSRKVLPFGAMEESSGKWQVLGFAECSGFGACAHKARLVRVDVAAGELHVAAQDVEAAALPEK